MKTDKAQPWFTSDTHWGHKNIIRHCDRPFSSIEEMDELLIQNWNAHIEDNTTIYHLGDFSFRASVDYAQEVLGRLNGRIHLVVGNHDHKDVLKFSRWESVSNLKSIKYHKQKIILCHYAMRSWDGKHRGSWHLFGHSHGQLMDRGKATDVGVDCWDYRPVSFWELHEFMAARDTYYNEHPPAWVDRPEGVPNQVMHQVTVAESKYREAKGELARYLTTEVDDD